MSDPKIPAHVAIIMDGNGRWAKKRGLPRTAGHKKGAEVVEQILEDADHMGIRYLTVYAFSTENWLRPAMEVKALMNLLRTYMISSMEKCAKNNVSVRVIGDRSKLSADLQESIGNLEEATKNNTGMHFQIAINYGGRDEIVRAVKKLVAKARAGEISEEDPHLRGAAHFQFPALADRLLGAVFHRCGLAGLHERRTAEGGRCIWQQGEALRRPDRRTVLTRLPIKKN